MTNEVFKEYTRSTAFSISLSQRMVEYLFIIEKDENDHHVPGFNKWHGYRYFIATGDSLTRRGLIERIPHGKKIPMGQPTRAVLTDAGRAMCTMLRLAGFEYAHAEDKKTA